MDELRGGDKATLIAGLVTDCAAEAVTVAAVDQERTATSTRSQRPPRGCVPGTPPSGTCLATANRSAGGKLDGFYSFDRIQFGDPFWVIVY
jgi:hypothetical protein